MKINELWVIHSSSKKKRKKKEVKWLHAFDTLRTEQLNHILSQICGYTQCTMYAQINVRSYIHTYNKLRVKMNYLKVFLSYI